MTLPQVYTYFPAKHQTVYIHPGLPQNNMCAFESINIVKLSYVYVYLPLYTLLHIDEIPNQLQWQFYDMRVINR